jgi:hypothetical protein
MSVYTNIETGFTQCHNGVEGAGGCPAKTALSLPVGNGQFFTIQGATQATNANVLWYQKLPFVAGVSNFLLEYDLVVDSNEANVWARERDFRVSNNGEDANFSCQLLRNANGYELDISNESGGWVNTGITVPALSPSIMHRFQHIGYFDMEQNVYSYELIVIDGIPYPIPSKLQQLKTTHLGWPSGIYPQFQQDLNGAQNQNLGFSELVMNMNLVTW